MADSDDEVEGSRRVGDVFLAREEYPKTGNFKNSRLLNLSNPETSIVKMNGGEITLKPRGDDDTSHYHDDTLNVRPIRIIAQAMWWGSASPGICAGG